MPLASSQNQNARSETAEGTQQCSIPGCEQNSATPNLGRLCLVHFIKASYVRLEELSRSTHTWSVGGVAWESARSFVQDCVQIATRFTQQKPDLPNLQRAQLVDITIWAAELGQRLRRSPRSPLAVSLRLISDIAGNCWEEETFSLDFSRHGARTQCQHVVKNDDVLKVIRLDTGEQAGARVVWVQQKTAGGQEIGIEFIYGGTT
jgi:hypothetical protein